MKESHDGMILKLNGGWRWGLGSLCGMMRRGQKVSEREDEVKMSEHRMAHGTT